MTKRKTTDSTNTINSTFSTSTSSSLTATPEAIELRLDLLPKDILTKIAEDTADHDALRELSTVSKFIRSTLFEMNPWSQLIKAHFPEAPIPTEAYAAQRAYEGLIKTEYFYFTPFMISLFTAVKNNDLRQVYQLVNSLEFSIDKLPCYTDRQGRCLLSWVMLKNDPDMIDYFKCLLDRCFEESTDIDIELLISQAKILGHTKLLSGIASNNIPEELREQIKRNIQCGQKVNEELVALTHVNDCFMLINVAASWGHTAYFLRLMTAIRDNPHLIVDPFCLIYDAANRKHQEFLQDTYTIFVSLIRQHNENIERDIHRLNYLCGKEPLDIDFGYGGRLSAQDIDEMTGEQHDIFLNQQAIFLADAIVINDLPTIKNILDRAPGLIDEEIDSIGERNTIQHAINRGVSYTTLNYLLTMDPELVGQAELIETLIDTVIENAVSLDLIHHALLLVQIADPQVLHNVEYMALDHDIFLNSLEILIESRRTHGQQPVIQ